MYILFINNNWRSEQRFLRPIFKSKPHTPLAFVHAQMTKLNLDHTLQVKCFCILKQVFSFLGNGHNKNLKLLKVKVCLFYKRIWMITPFSFFDDIFKNLSLVCKLHTSHVTQSMTLIVIIEQGISLVHISSSYHFLKLRY